MENKAVNSLYKVFDSMRGYLPYEEYSNICVYCTFMKYCLDNKKLPFDETTFDLQKMFLSGEMNEEALINASRMLEETYSFPQSSLVDFANTYIRYNVKQNADNLSTKILKALSDISFDDKSVDYTDILKEIIYSSAASFGRLMSDKVSNKSLSNLIGELLNIKDGDSYADLMYGFGNSSLEIVRNKKCSITGYEITRASVAVAKMLLIMSKRENFEINCVDTIKEDIGEDRFDKIATMPTLAVKINDLTLEHIKMLDHFNLPKKTINLESLLLLKAILSLKANGTAILVTSAGFLFTSTAVEKDVRKLIANKYLQAVIQLPNMYYGTNVSVVALVLTKEKTTDNVIFIDISTNNYFNFVDKSNRAVTNLTDAGITKVKEIYQNSEVIVGISNVVPINKIAEFDYLLSTSLYIDAKNKREVITTAEIDKKLKVLYERLRKITEV